MTNHDDYIAAAVHELSTRDSASSRLRFGPAHAVGPRGFVAQFSCVR